MGRKERCWSEVEAASSSLVFSANFMKNLTVLQMGVAFMICFMGSCSISNSTEQVKPKYGEDILVGIGALAISEQEEKLLKKRAIEGDNEAAFKLAVFYSFVVLDDELAIHWLKLAASRGSSRARTSLKTFEEDMEQDKIDNLKSDNQDQPVRPFSSNKRIF